MCVRSSGLALSLLILPSPRLPLSQGPPVMLCYRRRGVFITLLSPERQYLPFPSLYVSLIHPLLLLTPLFGRDAVPFQLTCHVNATTTTSILRSADETARNTLSPREETTLHTPQRFDRSILNSTPTHDRPRYSATHPISSPPSRVVVAEQ